jgi:hypothetical protein
MDWRLQLLEDTWHARGLENASRMGGKIVYVQIGWKMTQNANKVNVK